MSDSTTTNPAIAEMEKARAQLWEFAAYLNEASECLKASSQALERANEQTTILDCPKRKAIREELNCRYAALRFGVGALEKVLEAPILQAFRGHHNE